MPCDGPVRCVMPPLLGPSQFVTSKRTDPPLAMVAEKDGHNWDCAARAGASMDTASNSAISSTNIRTDSSRHNALPKVAGIIRRAPAGRSAAIVIRPPMDTRPLPTHPAVPHRPPPRSRMRTCFTLHRRRTTGSQCKRRRHRESKDGGGGKSLDLDKSARRRGRRYSTSLPDLRTSDAGTQTVADRSINAAHYPPGAASAAAPGPAPIAAAWCRRRYHRWCLR